MEEALKIGIEMGIGKGIEKGIEKSKTQVVSKLLRQNKFKISEIANFAKRTGKFCKKDLRKIQ